MDTQPIDPRALADQVKDAYANWSLSQVNDHEVRLGIMTEPFYWHRHPDSAEAFMVIEGVLRIEFADGAVDLRPGEMFTVPAGVPHRTLPLTPRSVNLTFEQSGAATERCEAPTASG